MAKKYALEDMQEGQKIFWSKTTVSREEIIEFASEFDPAPFHLNDEAAARTPLGKLSASGLHNCAMAMRMMCDAFFLDSTAQGAFGADKCRWLKPVFPGDTLSGYSLIESIHHSRSRPGLGVLVTQHVMTNQDGETVMAMTNTIMMRTRESFEQSFGAFGGKS